LKAIFMAQIAKVWPIFTVLPLTACLIATPASGDTSVPIKHNAPAGYELVFADEFSADGAPDQAKWAYATERNLQGWFNQEKQYYSDNRHENARVENGNLIIEAREETLDKQKYPDWSGQKYTSARMLTRGKASWTYGFFEIRAQLPCGKGTWPAIWTLPEDPAVEWPNGGEIDIMEHVGFAPGEINHTIHTKAFNFGKGSQKTSKYVVPDACQAMHRYQMLWTPNFILMGVDDLPKFIFKKVKSQQSRWPFNQPHHLLFNIAVGGSWGGQKGIDPKSFPAQMKIDYVRVYQPKEQITAAGLAKNQEK
jgi:beta-glucanase (GH16 family)